MTATGADAAAAAVASIVLPKGACGKGGFRLFRHAAT